ncbi:MAG: hypothetical protein V3T56_06340 [Gemmatimonadales bacterium]
MSLSAITRATLSTADRAEALGHFFTKAGEAPRVMAYDEDLGCPLHTALSAIEWTIAVGILDDADLVHAARLTADAAAILVERQIEENRVFIYMGPRMDAPPAAPQEGNLLFDEPGVRGFEFAQRANALAHFLRATQGTGSVISMLSRRPPQLLHIQRWIAALFEDPPQYVSNLMLAGWFATSGGGILFAPARKGDPYVYEEVGAGGE